MTSPPEFLCPITFQLMEDPVIAADGYTYERKAIEEWLRLNNTSPMTRQVIDRALIPNRALKDSIEHFRNASQPQENTAQEVPKVVPLDLSLNVARHDNETTLIHARITPPKEGERKPCAFICMLDVSGSMGDEASMRKEGAESDGFSRLDLVLHSMRTVVQLLNGQDNLAIISFSSNATIVLPWTRMTDAGKDQASQALANLKPNGSTNIWDSLRMALDMTQTPIGKQAENLTLLLFTDGESNADPPRGIVPTFTSYLKTKPFSGCLNTFGFGYNLDSRLLVELARVGSGSYSYIPDASMVGTIFVNSLSYTLATCAKGLNLKISPKLDDLETIDVGTIQYGQSRDWVIAVKNPPPADITVELVDKRTLQTVKSASFANVEANADELKVLYEQYARVLAVSTLRQVMTLPLDQAQALLVNTVDKIKALPNDPNVAHIIADLEGEVKNALSRDDWFTRWGRHYIPSLARAHELQLCNNFKDPGVQHYGGALFKTIQEEADTIFCSLPAPKPSCKNPQIYAMAGFGSAPAVAAFGAGGGPTMYPFSPAPAAAPVSMQSYYNSSGPCFSGDSLVNMDDGSRIAVRDLKRGHRTATGVIECVIQTRINAFIPMVQMSPGLKLTPWHPIKIGSAWHFPATLQTTSSVFVDSIYNFVMADRALIKIDGVECITLGHGIENDAVASHAYFGTERVVQDFQTLPGWTIGRIVVDSIKFKRSRSDGPIVGLLGVRVANDE